MATAERSLQSVTADSTLMLWAQARVYVDRLEADLARESPARIGPAVARPSLMSGGVTANTSWTVRTASWAITAL